MARLTPRDLQPMPTAPVPSGAVPIEQAIFTSARTARKDGYQLIAWSPGISAEDARLLAMWGPAHDSMIAEDPADVSINFHPLGEGKYCVSRTMLGTKEYSGRGGFQVYTYCFILQQRDWLRFQNDPFRVLAAALATRDLRPGAELPTDLKTLKMFPSGPAVEPSLIESIQSPSQQQAMVAWMHHVLSYPKLIFTGEYSESILAAFFNLLPVAVRLQFPFSTRLRHSPRRAFRLIGLANDAEEQKKAARQEGGPVFSWDSPRRSPEGSRHPWATWVQVALCQRQPEAAAELLGSLDLETRLEDLASEGNRLRLALSSRHGRTFAANEKRTAPVRSGTVHVERPLARSPCTGALALIEKAIEGDVTALEQFHQQWQSMSSSEQAENRIACAEHFNRLLQQRAGELGATAQSAVEILSLILRASG